ncbi:MAG: hypothetical protein KBB88_00930 [Candidatus Pacebacteria bacterium]|nr:hypothetical protein [Candidatus Paceibacterota bacterium]
MENKHGHKKIKIGVAGAAETGHCDRNVLDIAKEIGRAIALSGSVLISGATTGFPLWTAIGAKEKGGMTIGFSPAATEKEHVEVYRLPIDFMDVTVYTGFGYIGRDVLFTRSSDALIVGCGRICTIHAFTVAYQDRKPIGVIEGVGETEDIIKQMMGKGYEPYEGIIFDRDPERLVERLIEIVQKTKKEEENLIV